MMKTLLLTLVSLFLLLAATTGQAQDQQQDPGNSKLRVVFIKQTENKESLVFIRMTPGQFRLANSRARAKLGVGMVRIALHPRQVVALKKALGGEHRWNKVVVRISARRLKAMKGLKDRYIIRPLKAFSGPGDSEGDTLEIELL